MPSTFFTVAAPLALAHHLLLLPRRPRRRLLTSSRRSSTLRPARGPAARPARLLVAFPAVVVCGILLIVDLEPAGALLAHADPVEDAPPDVQAVLADVVGSWALLIFGALLVPLVPRRPGRRRTRPRWPRCVSFAPPASLGGIVAVLGGILGFFLAGYTGVLLVGDEPARSGPTRTLLGLTFLISGASTAAAAADPARRRRRDTHTGLHALERFDGWLLVFELVALIALVFSLGELARLWLGWWGALLVIGVVGLASSSRC